MFKGRENSTDESVSGRSRAASFVRAEVNLKSEEVDVPSADARCRVLPGDTEESEGLKTAAKHSYILVTEAVKNTPGRVKIQASYTQWRVVESYSSRWSRVRYALAIRYIAAWMSHNTR